MTDLTDVAQPELAETLAIEALCDARFPVAYSHGGFAQLRHATLVSDLNPLAPIQVPAEFDSANAAMQGASAVVFLRS